MEKINKKPYIIGAIVIVLLVGYLWHRKVSKKAAVVKTKTAQRASATTKKDKKSSTVTVHDTTTATPQDGVTPSK